MLKVNPANYVTVLYHQNKHIELHRHFKKKMLVIIVVSHYVGYLHKPVYCDIQ